MRSDKVQIDFRPSAVELGYTLSCTLFMVMAQLCMKRREGRFMTHYLRRNHRLQASEIQDVMCGYLHRKGEGRGERREEGGERREEER